MKTLALVPALAALAALAVAADGDLDRQVRLREADQRGLGRTTALSAKQIAELADEARFNQVADQAETARLGDAAVALAMVSDERGAGTTMEGVASRLQAAAREPARAGEEIRRAAGEAQAIAKDLDKTVQSLSALAASGGTQAVRQLADRQRALMRATDELAQQTVGKREDELSKAEKAERDRLAQQQERIKEQAADLAKKLDQAAQQAPDAKQAEELKQTADALRQDKPEDNARDAAAAIKRNDLDRALQEQEKLIDKLEKAPGKRDQLSEAEQQAALQQQQNDLAALQQEQEKLLAETEKTPDQAADAQWNKLAAQEADLAQRLAQEQKQTAELAKGETPPDAAAEAQKAKDELAAHDKKDAAEAMRKALAAMKQQQQALAKAQQQLQQKGQQQQQQQQQSQQQQQQAAQQSKPSSASEAVERELAKRRAGEWKVQLEGQERETIGNAAGERFPSRYEGALSRYYQALAQTEGDGK